MFNPYMWRMEGDLSRADVVVLTLLGRGKNIVEFGIGASTIIFSQIANKVITYEHDPLWIEKIKPRLNDKVEIRLIEKSEEAVKGIGEDCDILFDDGHSILRAPALLEFWPHIKEYAILHDSRMTYAGNCVKRFIDAFTPNNEATTGNPNKLPDNHYTGSLESIKWNYLDSNIVVMKKRNYTLLYENWKITEKELNAKS